MKSTFSLIFVEREMIVRRKENYLWKADVEAAKKAKRTPIKVMDFMIGYSDLNTQRQKDRTADNALFYTRSLRFRLGPWVLAFNHWIEYFDAAYYILDRNYTKMRQTWFKMDQRLSKMNQKWTIMAQMGSKNEQANFYCSVIWAFLKHLTACRLDISLEPREWAAFS